MTGMEALAPRTEMAASKTIFRFRCFVQFPTRPAAIVAMIIAEGNSHSQVAVSESVFAEERSKVSEGALWEDCCVSRQ